MMHLERDLENLKREIVDMGALVEVAVHKSVRALVDRRVELAREVAAEDDRIDAKEVAIEIECTKILALHHPVASDLRFVVTVLKLNNDLERIGDLACNLAERAEALCGLPALPFPEEFKILTDRAPMMLRDSLDAFVKEDPNLARQVRTSDDEVDECNRRMFTRMQDLMREDASTIDRAIQVLSCSRQLERIADLATNLGEEVVFLVEGDVIKHRSNV